MNRVKCISVICLLLCTSTLFGAAIHYEIDLRNADKGWVNVEVNDLKFSKDAVYLTFPKVVPGMYEEDNFGKYIYDAVAIYQNGKEKKLQRKKLNSFLIKDARHVVQIRYNVHQTNPSRSSGSFFLPAGSVFSNTYCLINFHALVGYFPNLQDGTYAITILKKDNAYGTGNVIFKSKSARVDSLIARSYHELIDAPMLYSQFSAQDTMRIFENNIHVKVAVTPNDYGLTASNLKSKISKVLKILSSNLTISKVEMLHLYGHEVKAKL